MIVHHYDNADDQHGVHSFDLNRRSVLLRRVMWHGSWLPNRLAPFASLSSSQMIVTRMVRIEMRFIFRPFCFFAHINYWNAKSFSEARFPIRAVAATRKIRITNRAARSPARILSSIKPVACGSVKT